MDADLSWDVNPESFIKFSSARLTMNESNNQRYLELYNQFNSAYYDNKKFEASSILLKIVYLMSRFYGEENIIGDFN